MSYEEYMESLDLVSNTLKDSYRDVAKMMISLNELARSYQKKLDNYTHVLSKVIFEIDDPQNEDWFDDLSDFDADITYGDYESVENMYADIREMMDILDHAFRSITEYGLPEDDIE